MQIPEGRRRRIVRSPALATVAALLAGMPSPALAEPASAQGIHERVLKIDTHIDIPLDFATATDDPSGYTTTQFDLPRMRAGGLDGAFLIVYTPQGRQDAAGYAAARATADTRWRAIRRTVDGFPDQVGLALSADDVARIRGTGRRVFLIGMENAYPLGESIGDVDDWARRGVRYVGITHVGHNQFATSSDPNLALGDRPGSRAGLTPLGRDLVRALNRAGIMVDISHVSREAMMETVALSPVPVIASHSSCRALTDHPRNLDDEQLRALAAKGGVVQVVAHPNFLGLPKPDRLAAISALQARLGLAAQEARSRMTPELRAQYAAGMAEIDQKYGRSSVSDLVDHVDHAVAVAGIDHVGIASDFDGGGGITGWSDVGETAAVTAELVRRGYDEAQIAKLWGGNLLRVMRAVQAAAGISSKVGAVAPGADTSPSGSAVIRAAAR
jgi:membrane dipeptidase